MNKAPGTGRDWMSHPPFRVPTYGSTRLRAPTQPLVSIPSPIKIVPGPCFHTMSMEPLESDLSQNAVRTAPAIGEKIIISGRVTDETGRPVARTLIEIWQANAAGKYIHRNDGHDAPIDPNFLGAGRTLTDDAGHYTFTTIRPGAYPWGNHKNAWRPPHVHFSLHGATYVSRLVTQMYFPGDPLLEYDPIFQGVPSGARQRMVAIFSPNLSREGFALGYEFNIVLRGRYETPFEESI